MLRALVVALCLASAAAGKKAKKQKQKKAKQVTFMDEATIVEMADAGGLDGRTKVKIEKAPKGTKKKKKYYKEEAAKLLRVMGCKDPSRIFTEAGKHEKRHKKAGLDRWFWADCADQIVPASAFAGEGKEANRAAGAEVVKAFRRLMVSPSSGDVLRNVEALEPGFAISLTAMPYDHFEESYAATARALSAAQQQGAAPDDPYWGDQSNCPTIDCLGVWEIGNGDKEVVVQVIDTGLDLAHEDHQDFLWVNTGEIPNNGVDDDGNGYKDDVNGCNFADSTCTQLLGDGGAQSHGTHCSGTISASRNNEKGIAGISGGSEGVGGISLMTGVGFGVNSVGGFEDALVYGADNGAWITSNSWGYTQPMDNVPGALKDAIDYFNVNGKDGKGGIVVFAAGNDNSNENYQPGWYDGTVAVAATDDVDKRAGFSNYGSWIDIAAPGVNVLSTFVSGTGSYKPGYQKWSGTSFSCPTVSGMLGACWGANKALTAAEVLNCLYSTAKNVDAKNPGYEGQLGAGVVSGGAFVTCCADGAPSPKPTISMEPTGTPTSSAPSISQAPTILYCGACDEKISLTIKTDKYPGEITWQVVQKSEFDCKHAETSPSSGGPYQKQYSVYVETIKNVCAETPYELVMKDGYGDAICCIEGPGWFQMEIEDPSEADGMAFVMGPYKGSPATGDASCGDKHEGTCKGAAYGSKGVFPFTVESKETPKPTVSPYPTPAPVPVCYGDDDRIGDGICDDAVGAGSADKDLYNNGACGWDGGDCCKCTCSGKDCGGKTGRNFHRCKDPDWFGDAKNDPGYSCDGTTPAPSPGPMPTTFESMPEFVDTHLVGASWYPSVVILSWQVKTDDNEASEFTIQLKDYTNGGPWTDHVVDVRPRTADGWYTWTGVGDSVKGALTSKFPFDCSTSYLARVKKGAALSEKVAITTGFCPGDCVDSQDWHFNKDFQNCNWITGAINNGANVDRLCSKTNEQAVSGYVACPVACDQCGATYASYGQQAAYF